MYQGHSPTIQTDPSPTKLLEMIAASFTPMHEDGSLHLEVVEQIAQRMVTDGVSGVFICGTTGEGMSLSNHERKEVTLAWKRVAPKELKVMVHVGHACIEEACDLARHAQAIGANAVAAIGPTFFAPAQLEALVKYNQKIASAAPDLPYFYYHLPSKSYSDFPASEIFEAFIEAIPNFAGVKFTHEDIPDFQRCASIAGEECALYFGRDELFLDGLKAEARAAIGSTYNFATPFVGTTDSRRSAKIKARLGQAPIRCRCRAAIAQ